MNECAAHVIFALLVQRVQGPYHSVFVLACTYQQGGLGLQRAGSCEVPSYVGTCCCSHHYESSMHTPCRAGIFWLGSSSRAGNPKPLLQMPSPPQMGDAWCLWRAS